MKTVTKDKISNIISLKKLLFEAEPLITDENTIPKSINKLTGTDNIKNVIRNKDPIAQIKIFICVKTNNIDVKINILIVDIKSITKKK